MNMPEMVLRNEEKAIYQLRALYRTYGYTQYKVSKFEEYDLYARHKNFLVSDRILTFTDTNGKLMALKPDVTLSIAKHVSLEDSAVQKVYYNESVYRTSAGGDGFREIMQTGLECIGHLDWFAEGEVVMLAMRSLQSISDDYLLDLSHMELLEGLLEESGVDPSLHSSFLALIGSKNLPGIRALCSREQISQQACETLCALTGLYLPLSEAVEEIAPLVVGEKSKSALEKLKKLSDTIREYGLSARLYFDFSIVSDMNYYDGLVFKGFVNGIPDSLLSGGRYDRLLPRLGKKEGAGAIGFAVYLDRLERYDEADRSFDTDVLLIYEDVTAKEIISAVRLLNDSGKSVRTSALMDSNIRCRQVVKLGKGGMEILETND